MAKIRSTISRVSPFSDLKTYLSSESEAVAILSVAHAELSLTKGTQFSPQWP